MFKKRNKIFSVIITVSLLLSLMTHTISAAYVDDGIVIQPQWQNVTNMVLILTLDNPEIYLKVTVTGLLGTTYQNGTVVLEKISGSNCGIVKRWSGISSSSNILTFTDNSATRTSGTYKLTFTATAIRNGISETVSKSKEATY